MIDNGFCSLFRLVDCPVEEEESKAAKRVWYVDVNNVSGTYDGLSWAGAFATLQEGIDAAALDGGGDVWVAAGEYHEERVADGSGALVLKQNVNAYGGFLADDEMQFLERDPETNVTIIDGSQARAGEAAWHVVKGADEAALYGFTITGGDATGAGDGMNGAGMANYGVSPTISRCKFTSNTADAEQGVIWNEDSSPGIADCVFDQNAGDAIYNSGAASPTIADCTFSGNGGDGIRNWTDSGSLTVNDCEFIDNGGRGIYSTGPQTVVTRCTFEGNSGDQGGAILNLGVSSSVLACRFARNVATDGGGAIYSGNGSYKIENCVFWENSAPNGGAMYDGELGAVTLTNCTFSGNSAGGAGGAIYNSASPFIVTNCIMWDDMAGGVSNEIAEGDGSAMQVRFSDVQGGADGTANIAGDPLFTDASMGDLTLGDGSPCIDSGTEIGAPGTDFDGADRPAGDGYDMGAYERRATGEGEGEGEYEIVCTCCDPPGEYLCLQTAPDTGDAVRLRTEDATFGPGVYHWRVLIPQLKCEDPEAYDGDPCATGSPVYREGGPSSVIRCYVQSPEQADPFHTRRIGFEIGYGRPEERDTIVGIDQCDLLCYMSVARDDERDCCPATVETSEVLARGFNPCTWYTLSLDLTVDEEGRYVAAWYVRKEGDIDTVGRTGFTCGYGPANTTFYIGCAVENLEDLSMGSHPPVVRQRGWFDYVAYCDEEKQAIWRGLQWLTDAQYFAEDSPANGSWSLNVGITGMCAMAFLNYGYDYTDPRVEAALEYIMANKDVLADVWGTGSFGQEPTLVNYNTSIALLTMLATRNSAYVGDASAAAYFLLAGQNTELNGADPESPVYGGWSTEPNPSMADLASTHWVLSALDAAYALEGSVHAPPWAWDALVFLENCQDYGTAKSKGERVWFVDRDNSSGNEDGMSWTTAFTTIQPAIDAAAASLGGEVWVAAGRYDGTRTSYPHGGEGDEEWNTGSLLMRETVHVYGGFLGDEATRSERDWAANATTIDGSTARDGARAYHVVVGANGVTLSGFTITGGNAVNADHVGDGQGAHGGGMFNEELSIVITDCCARTIRAGRR